MSNIEVELQNFIKKTILTLACCNNLDHRNYDCKKKDYRLKELAKNNSIDNSIIIIVKEILENQILTNQDDEEDENNDDFEENEDEKYDRYNSIFIDFIEYIGLYEIYNLHADSLDIFFDDFMKIIKKYNF